MEYEDIYYVCFILYLYFVVCRNSMHDKPLLRRSDVNVIYDVLSKHLTHTSDVSFYTKSLLFLIINRTRRAKSPLYGCIHFVSAKLVIPYTREDKSPQHIQYVSAELIIPYTRKNKYPYAFNLILLSLLSPVLNG